MLTMTSTERVQSSGSPSWATLGDRITKARKLAGMDLKQLDEKTGIHRNSLSKYESDRGAPPRPYMLKAIAVACGISYDWLRTGEGDPQHPDAGTPFDGPEPPTGRKVGTPPMHLAA